MPKSGLRISMLGTTLNISAEADSIYLQQLLEKYRQFVEQTKKTTSLEDPLKLAILSGFLLCDEIEKNKSNSPDIKGAGIDENQRTPAQQSTDKQQAAEKLTLGLITLLEETLGD